MVPNKLGKQGLELEVGGIEMTLFKWHLTMLAQCAVTLAKIPPKLGSWGQSYTSCSLCFQSACYFHYKPTGPRNAHCGADLPALAVAAEIRGCRHSFGSDCQPGFLQKEGYLVNQGASPKVEE